MFIDIAFNGTWRDFKNSLDKVMNRARQSNVMPILVGLDIESSSKCLELAKVYKTCCFMGVHPLHIDSSVEDIKQSIRDLDYSDDHIAGIGECGLDFYRSSKKKEQIEVFREHLSIPGLPFFYHCRNSFDEFIKVLDDDSIDNSIDVYKGVVHSFDGTFDQAMYLISRGVYIGINGCSLKTKENLEVIRQIPVEWILLETDSPFCLIKKSYACSMCTTLIKASRNEPAYVVQIAQVVAELKGISIEEFEGIAYENTLRAFPNIRKYANDWK